MHSVGDVQPTPSARSSAASQSLPVPVWRLPQWLISPFCRPPWEKGYTLYLTTGSRPDEKNVRFPIDTEATEAFTRESDDCRDSGARERASGQSMRHSRTRGEESQEKPRYQAASFPTAFAWHACPSLPDKFRSSGLSPPCP